MAGPWEAYQSDKKPTSKERESGAEATSAEAEAPFAGRKAKASAELTEAQVRRANAAAVTEEQKAAAAAEKGEAAKAAAGQQKTERVETLSGYLGQLQRARDVISTGVATGLPGQITSNVWGTPSADLKGILESISNPIVLEAMAEARKGSAQGATGFGALSQKELELLKGKFGSLRQAQSDQSLLETIDAIDKSYRRLMAYNAGYDPYTVEGSMLVGLPPPEGTEAPQADMDIGPAGGQMTEDPELRGVDAAIVSMIKANRSPEQIRAWLDAYKPGLGDEVKGLEGQIEYFKKTGKDPQSDISRVYTAPEGGETALSEAADTGPGAMAVAGADQLLSGFMGEIGAGETSGSEYERTSAVLRGLRDKYPGWSTAGDVAGGVLSAAGGAAAMGKAGLRLPGLFEGVGQEAMYGIGSAEPGQRVEGGIAGGLMAPVTNLVGKVGSDAIGGALRGADPARAALVEKYGINLTPGQLTGRGDERSLAGLPVLGPQITERRNETIEQFNSAAFRDALAPIGAQTGAIGQRGIAEAQQATSQAYRDALDGVTLTLDQPFMQSVRGAPYAKLAQLRDIGPELTQEVDGIFARYADPQTGTLTGEGMQNAMQELQKLSNAYKGDARWANRIAPALDDISDGYAGLLERQAPENFQMFNRANEAYRNVSILERAVESAPNGDVFGPANLRTATKLGTQRFGGKKASARGDRPFNELVMSALDVVPNRADDVSLTGRVLAPAAGAGGFGAITATGMLASNDEDKANDRGDGGIPAWMLAAAAGTGLATIPYGRRGLRATTRPLLGPRTDTQRTLGEMLQTYGPAALRGATRDTEPGAPMPQDFDYSNVGSADFRKIVEAAAAGAQPLTEEEQVALGTGGGFTDVDVDGNPVGPQGGMSIGGRPVERDPATGEMIFSDTGEPVPGFAEGGQVAFQQRQRAQQEGIAQQRRDQERQLSQSRDSRVAPGRQRAAASGYRRTAEQRTHKTSHMTDLAMAASRRGNDLVATLADLTDRYVKPADAVAWIAQNIEGRDPAEVARIRQNLQPVDSFRSVVNAGAIENERRFAEAGGLGARTGDDVAPPVRLGAAMYRPQDIPGAVASETPRAMSAVRDYFARSTPQGVLDDAMGAAKAGWQGFRKDPYGAFFENAVYANPYTALAAAPFDYAGAREGSEMLANPEIANMPGVADTRRMVDALSVLPAAMAAPAVAGGGGRRAARSLAAKRRGR